MYAYRDWVIKAFNRNQPFDQFTVDQIAGDLLPDPTLDQLIATGLQRNNITTNEGGAVIEEYEAIYAKDRAETLGSVFMGMTVGCAACHDHKFDPISQREFYALTAFFRNTTQYVMDGNISDPPPTLVVPRDEDRDTWYRLREEVGEIEDALAERPDAVEAAFEEWLANGGHQSIEAPLGTPSELLRLDLDGEEPAAILKGERQPLPSSQGIRIEPGPNGLPAVLFEGESWVELPNLELDTESPFSLAMWIYMPEAEGSYTVASQSDPHDANRGWQVTLGARELYFRLRGDRAGREGARPACRSIRTTRSASRPASGHTSSSRTTAPANAAACTSTATATASPNRAASSSPGSRAASALTARSTWAARIGERRAAPSTSPAEA